MENRCGNDSKEMNITDVYCKFVTHVHMLILLALYSVNNRLLNVSVVRKFYFMIHRTCCGWRAVGAQLQQKDFQHTVPSRQLGSASFLK